MPRRTLASFGLETLRPRLTLSSRHWRILEGEASRQRLSVSALLEKLGADFANDLWAEAEDCLRQERPRVYYDAHFPELEEADVR